MPFAPSASVILTASGNGTTTIGPRNAGEQWVVTAIGTRVSTNVLEPTFRYYTGTNIPANFQGGSFSGSQDADSSMNPLTLRTNGGGDGSFLTLEWTGGDSGARATATLTVTRTYDT